MKRIIAGLLALTLGAPVWAQGAPAPQPAPQPLTLPQALARALQTSPRLEEARAGIASAKAAQRGARAEGMPQVGLNAAGRFQGPNVSVGAPAGVPGAPAGDAPSFNPSRLFEGTIDFSLPLYTGGRVKAGKRGARAQERAALARVEAEAQRLVLDVTEAYLDTLQARRQADLAARLRELNTERLRVAQAKTRLGEGIPLEVSNAEADLALSVQQEIEATARVGQAGATLNTLIGRPAREALTLAPLPETEGRLPTPAGQSTPPTPEQLQALGLERPDLRALRAEVTRAEAQVDSARAARRPFVALTGNLLKRIPETLLGGFAWAIGGAIVQSLFDGGRSRAQVEAARAERLRSGATLKEAERQVEEQVEQLRLAVEAAEKRLAAEEARVSAAQEALRVAQSQLRAGIVAEVFVTEAETVLARAQTDTLNARFEAARSRARLVYAAGIAYPETVTAVTIASANE